MCIRDRLGGAVGAGTPAAAGLGAGTPAAAGLGAGTPAAAGLGAGTPAAAGLGTGTAFGPGVAPGTAWVVGAVLSCGLTSRAAPAPPASPGATTGAPVVESVMAACPKNPGVVLRSSPAIPSVARPPASGRTFDRGAPSHPTRRPHAGGRRRATSASVRR